jgi:hypothetical protein
MIEIKALVHFFLIVSILNEELHRYIGRYLLFGFKHSIHSSRKNNKFAGCPARRGAMVIAFQKQKMVGSNQTVAFTFDQTFIVRTNKRVPSEAKGNKIYSNMYNSYTRFKFISNYVWPTYTASVRILNNGAVFFVNSCALFEWTWLLRTKTCSCNFSCRGDTLSQIQNMYICKLAVRLSKKKVRIEKFESGSIKKCVDA